MYSICLHIANTRASENNFQSICIYHKSVEKKILTETQDFIQCTSNILTSEHCTTLSITTSAGIQLPTDNGKGIVKTQGCYF